MNRTLKQVLTSILSMMLIISSVAPVFADAGDPVSAAPVQQEAEMSQSEETGIDDVDNKAQKKDAADISESTDKAGAESESKPEKTEPAVEEQFASIKTVPGNTKVYPVLIGHDYSNDRFSQVEWADYIDAKEKDASAFYDEYLSLQSEKKSAEEKSNISEELSEIAEAQIKDAKPSPEADDPGKLPLGIYFIDGEGYESEFIELTEAKEYRIELEKEEVKTEETDKDKTDADEDTASLLKQAPIRTQSDDNRSSDGTAYAVLEDDGDMIFFRSNDTYSNLDKGTFTDILGNTYSGTVFASFEQIAYLNQHDSPWDTYKSSIKTVSVAEGQKIAPRTCRSWFHSCEYMTSCNLSGLDTSNVTNMRAMFCNCKALKSLDLSAFDTSNVTNMRNMFEYCTSLANLNLSGFDTSSVTDMYYMFRNCEKLVSLDLSGWDTSHVTGMGYMFSECYVLASLDVSSFDTSSVTDMSSMFNRCRTLTSLDLSGWDTSKVTDMWYMFNNCDKLVTLDLSGWDTSHVTGMGYMFSDCESLRRLDLSSFDTSNITSMMQMFYDCNSLTSLDVSGFDTSNVVIMESMFRNCYALPRLDVSGFDTSKVKNMRCMFAGCQTITSLDVSGFDTSNVMTMDSMFSSCYALAELDVSGFDTSNVTDMGDMFSDCRTLKSLDVSGFDTSKVTTMGDMFRRCFLLKNLDVSGFDTSNVYYMSYMFGECCNLLSLDVTGFDTSKVSTMSSMFNGCSKLTSLDVTGFNTSKVYDMSSMFDGCSKLTSLDVTGFDTSQVTIISAMFEDCNSLTSIDISGFDTSKATSMDRFFYGCNSLTSIDVSGLNTSKVTNMRYMFYNCKSLTALDVSSLDTSKVTDMSYMFSGCTALKSLDVTGFDTSTATILENMFSNCQSLPSLDISDFNTLQATKMSNMFSDCDSLAEIKLGSEFSFTGRYALYKALLPGEKWIRKTTDKKYTSTELSVTYDGSTMADTYYRVVTVIFNGTGGNVEGASREGYIGGTFDELPSADKKGYAFAGWYTEIDGGTHFNPGDEITQAEYYAHWTPNIYILILDPNGGTGAVPPIPLAYDQEYAAGEPYTKEGFRFDGWNTRKNGTGDRYDKTDVLSMLTEENGGTVTLYAQWTQENCIVTFDSLGGSEVPPKVVKTGKTVGELYSPVREGYTFIEWRTEESGGTAISHSTIINSDCTFYAHWEKAPVVTFNANGGTVTEESRCVKYNDSVGELPIPTRKNYTFDGWYTNPAAGTKITSAKKITSDVTYFAHWKIRLNFDPNGGKITKDAKYVPPEAATATIKILKTDNVSEDGSSFSGGYGNNKAETKTETIPNAEKLYVRITYQTEGTSCDWVSIYPSGITPSVSNYSSSVSGKLGGTTKTTKVFEVPGDTVQIFFRTDGSAERYYGYYAEISDNDAVFMDWSPYTDSPEDYTVVALAEAAKDGYEFDGWYTDPVGGTKVSIGDNMDLTSGSTVYAHWKASEKVTVTFDSNGGSECDPMTIYKGQEIGVLPRPTRDGYVFAGWFPDPQRKLFGIRSVPLEAGKRVTEDTVIDNDVTLYARWDPTYTVTFDGNGVNQTLTRKVTENGTLNTIPGMKRAQFVLEGWYPNADGTGEKLTTDTVIESNTKYYAKWVPEMTDKTSGNLSYSYSATWSNASNTNADNVNGNLEFHPTDNQRQTASLHIRFEMNEAIDTVAPVGSVRIRIPKYVFKGWDGQPVDTNNISSNLPKYPNTRNGMLFSYMEEDDAYVLINNTALVGGAGVDATFSYYVYPNRVPGGAMDYDGNYIDGYDFYKSDIPVTFNIDSDLDGTTETSDRIDLSIEMHTKVRSEQFKACTNVRYTWDDSWGEKPIDADDYFYIVWKVTERILSPSNQPYRYSISEDTVHDGTVIVLPQISSEQGTSASSSISGDYSETIVTKHSKSLLADIDESGKTFHNEAIVTEHWKSGYETPHLVKADTIVYGRRYPTGEWDKHYQGWRNGSNVKYGGQEDILDDNKEVNIPYELVYDGESNGQPVTWDEETRTYNAPERTIMMRDGVPGDVMYSSGWDIKKYIWQPRTGNKTLGDNDYYIKSLSLSLMEYDALQNNGLWTDRYGHSNRSHYKPVEIYVRLRGEEEFIRYKEVDAVYGATVVDLPANTVGFEIRHTTNFYSTYLSVKANMYLKPTQKVKNLIRNDVALNATSIIKNRAICHIWNGDDEAHPFFEATNYKTDDSSAFKDLWELNVSTTNLRVKKYSAPETSTVFDVGKGTQDTPMLISGMNYNNSSRVKRLTTGVFYDLLPMGTTVDENTLYGVAKTSNSTTSSVSKSSYESMKSSAVDKNYYSVEFVDNWEDSGRTMMIITVGLPDKIKACGIDFYYMLHNTYENVVDRGTTVENDVAFANTTENKTPYNAAKTDPRSVIKDSQYYASIENRYGDDVAFAQASAHYIPVDAFSWGYYKSVMTGSSYDSDGATVPNNEYTYRLTYSQSEYSKSDKIVFFDVLEGGTETNPSQWYGELQNVNVLAAADMVSATNSNVKCAPVIYYSTKARNSFTGEDWDVTNTNTWSRTKPADNADITAVAVDCSKATDGSDFVMKGKTAMNIYITMKAPGAAENIGKSSTNEGVHYARKFTTDTPEGEPTPEYADTTITIKDTDEELHKTSDPETGTEAEPASVVYGDVINYTIAYTNKDENITYHDVVLTDTVPDGLTIEKNNVSVYIADPDNAVKIGSSARASMTKTGQKLDFLVNEVLPGETVHIVIPTTVDVREGTFVNQAEKISVNGYEKSIKSEKTYHKVKPANVKILKRVLGTDEVLPGAALQLLNSSNNVVEEWISTDQPKEFILGADTYTLHEKTPPEGYFAAADIRFEVTRDGEVTCNAEGALDTSDGNVLSMFDKATSVDVNISKAVTGSFGNKTKQFNFTANITGLIPSRVYKLKKNSTETSIVASPEGNAEATFTLADNEAVLIKGLPSGAKLTVTEAASDHIASYEASDGAGALCSGANEASNAALSTEEMTLDVDRGAVNVSYTNNQDSVIPTGIRAAKSAFAVFALILTGILLLIRKKKPAQE